MVYFNSKTATITNDNQINKVIQSSIQHILKKIGQWLSEGSGWVIDSVDSHYFNIVKYKPMKGKSYIKLPPELQNSSKGLINIKSNDNECFRCCHIRHINPQEVHSERTKKSERSLINKLDYSNIEFPVDVKQYNKIEKQNNINVNVLGYENEQNFPIYISKEKFDDHLNLLLITNEEIQHYVLIKDFNQFMYNQTKHEYRKYFCVFCIQCFSSEDVLNQHKTECIVINGQQAIKMPQKGDNIIKFKNCNRQLKAPFVIYADFEAITEKNGFMQTR